MLNFKIEIQGVIKIQFVKTKWMLTDESKMFTVSADTMKVH